MLELSVRYYTLWLAYFHVRNNGQALDFNINDFSNDVRCRYVELSIAVVVGLAFVVGLVVFVVGVAIIQRQVHRIPVPILSMFLALLRIGPAVYMGWGDVTSLWSRDDRHFVGITLYNAPGPKKLWNFEARAAYRKISILLIKT